MILCRFKNQILTNVNYENILFTKLNPLEEAWGLALIDLDSVFTPN